MILTGVTKAMLERALKEQTMISSTPPLSAIEHIAKCFCEHECADWEIDEQKSWDELSTGSKQIELARAAWVIGRLETAGLVVVAKPKTDDGWTLECPKCGSDHITSKWGNAKCENCEQRDSVAEFEVPHP